MRSSGPFSFAGFAMKNLAGFRSPTAGDTKYYAAIGLFVSRFAEIDGWLLAAIGRCLNLRPEITHILFGGKATKDLIDTIRSALRYDPKPAFNLTQFEELAVEGHEVCPAQPSAADGGGAVQARMRPVPIVGVQPAR